MGLKKGMEVLRKIRRGLLKVITIFLSSILCSAAFAGVSVEQMKEAANNTNASTVTTTLTGNILNDKQMMLEVAKLKVSSSAVGQASYDSATVKSELLATTYNEETKLQEYAKENDELLKQEILTGGAIQTAVASAVGGDVSYGPYKQGGAGTINIGPKTFCAIGTKRSDSNDDGYCQVYKSGSNWYMYYSQQSYVGCGAVCF